MDTKKVTKEISPEEKERYNKEICEALTSMKYQDLQKFLNKNDPKVAVKFKKMSKTQKNITLCKLILKGDSFKNTEQERKAKSFLSKHGIEVK